MTYWAYIAAAYVALLCALVFVTNRRGEPMRRTVLTLFAVMLAGYAYSFTLGSEWDYSCWMILVNALGCVAITIHPAGRWQALVGWSFIIQIGTDVGRVSAELYFGSSDINYVYWGTVALAYTQLLLVGGWWLDERFGYSRRLGDNLPPRQARREGVA